jgi:hypothetical protein
MEFKLKIKQKMSRISLFHGTLFHCGVEKNYNTMIFIATGGYVQFNGVFNIGNPVRIIIVERFLFRDFEPDLENLKHRGTHKIFFD